MHPEPVSFQKRFCHYSSEPPGQRPQNHPVASLAKEALRSTLPPACERDGDKPRQFEKNNFAQATRAFARIVMVCRVVGLLQRPIGYHYDTALRR
jgi:hypothetical protein